MLAPTNTENAEFGGPGQRTQGREDVCFHAFHVYHSRKGDSEAPKTQKHATTRLQVILASVYGFSDHRRAGRVETNLTGSYWVLNERHEPEGRYLQISAVV